MRADEMYKKQEASIRTPMESCQDPDYADGLEMAHLLPTVIYSALAWPELFGELGRQLISSFVAEWRMWRCHNHGKGALMARLT